MKQQTKDEAREETLQRWQALPQQERQTLEQANHFAAALADEFDFRTMGNRRRVILGWLVRDLDGLPAWGNVPPESIALEERAARKLVADEAALAEAEAEPDGDEEDHDNDNGDEAHRHAAE